jgi:hypothetical protein
MAEERGMVIHFADGSKMDLSFPPWWRLPGAAA